MLGTRGPQRGLFEADTQYADFVGRDTFYGWLAGQRGELFVDELFLGLYVGGWGRPSVPPSLLATALVLQTYDRVSDEEATRRAAYDLQWKVALGVEVDARPFAKSTLQEFRAQLVLHEEQRRLFQQSLEVAKRDGKLRQRRQLQVALDTTPILGRGAVKDTYNLLGDGIVAVLRVLAAQAGVGRGEGDAFTAWATEAGYGRYVGDTSLKGGAAIDWSDAAARRQFLAEIVADADRVLAQARVARGLLVAGSPEDTALVAAAGLLSRVLGQDVDRTETGPAVRQGTAPDRLLSIHDPEMRHGRKSASKRFDGHKGAVAVDTEEQLITAVDVLAGNAPDHQDALELVEQTEAATECAVEETFGDCAYGDGETRQKFADAGRTLHAKVPAMTNGERFPKTAFTLDQGYPHWGPTRARVPAPPGRRRRTCGVRPVGRSTSSSPPRPVWPVRCRRSASRAPVAARLPGTRRRRSSNRRGPSKPATPSRRSAGAVRRWSTGSRDWCSWGSGRPATSGPPRCCSNWPWPLPWPISPCWPTRRPPRPHRMAVQQREDCWASSRGCSWPSWPSFGHGMRRWRRRGRSGLPRAPRAPRGGPGNSPS